MPTINLYHFTKKSNSTAIPDASTATAVTFTYKDECSTHSPILLFEWDGKPDFTYAQIGSIYYFITDIVYVRQKLWQMNLKEDCLGTFREQIKNSEQLIGRTSTACTNTIIDSECLARVNPAAYVTSANLFTYQEGCVILGIAGGSGLKYYAITYANFMGLLSQIFAEKQDNLWENIVDAASKITQTFLNVTDYIKSAHWLPFNFFSGQHTEFISLGYWDSGISGSPLAPMDLIRLTGEEGITLNLPASPKDNFYWKNFSPGRRCRLHLPFAGDIDIDPAIFTAGVNIVCRVDFMGAITYEISSTTNSRTYILNADCSVPLAVTSNLIDKNAVKGVITAGIGLAGTLATGGLSTAVNAGLAVGGISAVATGAIPEPTTNGSTGTFSGVVLDSAINLYTLQYNYETGITARRGFVYLRTGKLKNNGYYEIINPISNFGDYHENQEIATMMEGGFYIE